MVRPIVVAGPKMPRRALALRVNATILIITAPTWRFTFRHLAGVLPLTSAARTLCFTLASATRHFRMPRVRDERGALPLSGSAKRVDLLLQPVDIVGSHGGLDSG
jgi:hypothetical protein